MGERVGISGGERGEGPPITDKRRPMDEERNWELGIRRITAKTQRREEGIGQKVRTKRLFSLRLGVLAVNSKTSFR
jgi:hypothetical protein